MIDYQLRAAKNQQRALREASGYVPPSKPQADPKPLARRLRISPHSSYDLWPIANAIMEAVGNCVPDGDPIDHLSPKLQRMGIDRWDVTKWLDKACRKHLGCTSYNQYLIDAWDGWNEVCEPDQRIDNPWR